MGKYFIFLVAFWAQMSAYAGGIPPAPGRRGGPPPPPGLPVDQYLIILFILGVLLYIVYNKKTIKE